MYYESIKYILITFIVSLPALSIDDIEMVSSFSDTDKSSPPVIT